MHIHVLIADGHEHAGVKWRNGQMQKKNIYIYYVQQRGSLLICLPSSALCFQMMLTIQRPAAIQYD